MPLEPPAGENQVAVSTPFQMHIHLIQRIGRVEGFGEQARLMVESRTADVAVDFLQTDEIGVLFLDNVDNPFNPVSTVAPADSFVDIVTQQPHPQPAPHKCSYRPV